MRQSDATLAKVAAVAFLDELVKISRSDGLLPEWFEDFDWGDQDLNTKAFKLLEKMLRLMEKYKAAKVPVQSRKETFYRIPYGERTALEAELAKLRSEKADRRLKQIEKDKKSGMCCPG